MGTAISLARRHGLAVRVLARFVVVGLIAAGAVWFYSDPEPEFLWGRAEDRALHDRLCLISHHSGVVVEAMQHRISASTREPQPTEPPTRGRRHTGSEPARGAR